MRGVGGFTDPFPVTTHGQRTADATQLDLIGK
jgi:hypothetical protein